MDSCLYLLPCIVGITNNRSQPSFGLSSTKKRKTRNIISVGRIESKHVNANKPAYDQGDQSLENWIKNNDDFVRASPLFLGSGSFTLVLLNRTLSGIAPVADASSAQSRADVAALVLAATVVLTGLVWLTIKPKKLTSVQLRGVECLRLDKYLPSKAAREVMWAWEALSGATCCQALVIVHRGHCVLQAGLAAEAEGSDHEAALVDVSRLVKGSLCQAVWVSGKMSYLANLSLYPGRFELDFLPSNTQAVILQPLGDEGVMIIGGDTVRGFTSVDQAWISSIGEKLEASLEDMPSSPQQA